MPCAGWSPDGEQIVYIADNQVRIAQSDGTDLRAIATVNGSPFWPRWSPDGRKIRFSVSANKGLTVHLWEVGADGSHLHSLFPALDKTHCRGGSWTPDGKYFVFNADEQIWVSRERTTAFNEAAPVPLTTGPMSSYAPSFAPGGRRLYVESYEPRLELVEYDPKSDKLDSLLSGLNANYLEYARDGKSIIFVTGDVLWRSAPDGSQRHQLTPKGFAVIAPHFSQDGRYIAFCRFLPGSDSKIYVLPFDGGKPEQVTDANHGKGGDWDPAWSADGNSIVFGDSYETADLPQDRRKLHRLDLKTRTVSDLPGSEGMWSPRYSHDGRFLIGLSAPGWKPMLYDFRTKRQTELSTLRASYPALSADDQSIYFASSGETRGWWRVRIRDHKLEAIRSPKNFPAGNGVWFAVTPGDLIVSSRYISSSQIYALDLGMR
jgi:Tol biopolymer transport system component